MAKKSGGSGANDFLEILMLTGFFCAIFFACWGGYLLWQRSSGLETRNREFSDLKKMHEFLIEQEQRDRMVQHVRIEESKRDAGTMRAAVQEVLSSIPSSGLTIASFQDTTRRTTRGDSKIQEAEAKVIFQSARPISEHIEFLSRLKAEKPHLNVERLRLTRKTRRNEDPNADSWDANMDLVAYITETDGDEGEQ